MQLSFAAIEETKPQGDIADSWINGVLRPLRKDDLEAEIDLMGWNREAIKRSFRMKKIVRWSFAILFVGALVLVMS